MSSWGSHSRRATTFFFGLSATHAEWREGYAEPMKFRIFRSLFQNRTLTGTFTITEFSILSGFDEGAITNEDLDFISNVLRRNNGNLDAALGVALQDRLRTLNTGNWVLPFTQLAQDDEVAVPI